jgi:hypothetical protein
MLPHVHPAESGVRLVRGIVKDVQLNKLIVDNVHIIPYKHT